MRKYFLPTLVFAAIAALIVVLVKATDDPPPVTPGPETEPESAEQPEERPKGWQDDKRNTRLSLREHEWLSELERTLQREDLSRARWFRHKVCEDIGDIAQDEKLAGALLGIIRDFGLSSDDPERRDVTIPILRVFEHPEATAMIESEYFKARTQKERMMLLDAMSRTYHDPRKASVWAIEMALNAENEEDRTRALRLICDNSKNDDLIATTSIAVYEGSTRPEQRSQALRAVSTRGWNKIAHAYLKEQMANPRPGEILDVTSNIANWGDDEDLARLEQLADEFPVYRDTFDEVAQILRSSLADRKGLPPPEEPEPSREAPPEEHDPDRPRKN